MSIVLNISSHPIDLDDGRILGPGEVAEDVDLDIAHNQGQLEDGHLRELDAMPKDTPRPTEDEDKPTTAPTELGTPAAAELPNEAAPVSSGGNP